jgi:hypothetical protein
MGLGSFGASAWFEEFGLTLEALRMGSLGAGSAIIHA